jgi:uncharacterized protein YciI
MATATATATRSAPQASSIGMFMIELTFAVSLSTLHASAAAHLRFLRRHYTRGIFLIARRPPPGNREIILAVAPDREQLQSLMREDPWCELGLVDVRIVQLDARARGIDHRSAPRRTAMAPATRSAPRRPRLRLIHTGQPEFRQPGRFDGRRETQSSPIVAVTRDTPGTSLPRESPARRIHVIWSARQAEP